MGAGFAAGLGLLTAYWLQPSFLYFGRKYASLEYGIVRQYLGKNALEITSLSYSFDGLKPQTSYLVTASMGTGDTHTSMLILIGGNGMTAFDWIEWIVSFRATQASFMNTSFLLVDFPGYGANGGHPSPDSMHVCVDQAVNAALRSLATMGVEVSELNLIGHSIGASVASRWVASLRGSIETIRPPVATLILSAPFTSIPDMTTVLFPGVPAIVAKLISRHNWDNKGLVSEIVRHSLAQQVVVVHGRADEIVPFRMGEELARIDNRRMKFVPVDEASHNDLLGYVPVYASILTSTTGGQARL